MDAQEIIDMRSELDSLGSRLTTIERKMDLVMAAINVQRDQLEQDAKRTIHEE